MSRVRLAPLQPSDKARAGHKASAEHAHGYKVSPALLGWVALGALANMPFGGGDAAQAQLLVGLVGLAHAVLVYWRDGGQRISAPGVYMIASGLFVFFPALYLYFDDPMIHGQVDYVAAVNIAFWSQLVLYYLFWEPRPHRDNEVILIGDRGVTTWGIWAGVLLVAGGVVLVNTPLSSYGFDDGAAFAGITLLAVSSFRRSRRVTLFAYLLLGLSFVVYMEFVFAGFGRLQIGALGIAIAAAAAHRWKGRTVKLALLLAFPPVLSYLAASRVAFTGSLNPNQSASVTGLESAVAPFVRFAEVLHLESAGLITNTYFHTFFAAAVALVPREVWPTKPIGFGAELGDFFRPDLLGRGHSEAALFHGEWVFAFGFLGLAVFVPFMGLLVLWIDRAAHGAGPTGLVTRSNLVMIAAFLILTASITDLIWGGAFTYTSRVGPRLICLFGVFLLFGWHVSRPKGEEGLDVGWRSSLRYQGATSRFSRLGGSR